LKNVDIVGLDGEMAVVTKLCLTVSMGGRRFTQLTTIVVPSFDYWGREGDAREAEDGKPFQERKVHVVGWCMTMVGYLQERTNVAWTRQRSYLILLSNEGKDVYLSERKKKGRIENS
jgi:hypothetical protein